MIRLKVLSNTNDFSWHWVSVNPSHMITILNLVFSREESLNLTKKSKGIEDQLNELNRRYKNRFNNFIKEVGIQTAETKLKEWESNEPIGVALVKDLKELSARLNDLRSFCKITLSDGTIFKVVGTMTELELQIKIAKFDAINQQNNTSMFNSGVTRSYNS